MSLNGVISKVTAIAVAAASLVGAGAACAQTTSTIFPAGWDSKVRDRLFMKLDYIYIKNKTKSGDAYQVGAPVLTAEELQKAAAFGDLLDSSDPLSSDNWDIGTGSYALAAGALRNAVRELGGLSIPAGIKAEVGNAKTVALTVGYWFNEDQDWSVEALVLGVPPTIKAKAKGLNYAGKPFGISGKEVLSTKVLTPIVALNRYFGEKDSLVRPFVGVGATYAVFFDSKATDDFDRYSGGKTSVSLRNDFALGPFIGLTSGDIDGWKLSFTVGSLKLKTQATLTTRNTQIRTGDAVLQDFSKTISSAVVNGERNFDENFTTKLMQVVARYRGQSDLGTYVRKQDNEIRSTIFMLSVGTSF